MTTPARREAVAAALYALVDAAAGRVVDLRTSSRAFRHWDQVDVGEMPALFQVQLPEDQERPGQGLPAKRTMRFELWVYAAGGQSPDDVPSASLNAVADAVEQALAPEPLSGRLTLDNMVAHCWIEGSVGFYEGLTRDGKSIAVIPVAALLP